MEETYIVFLSYGQYHRKYFFRDFDEAKAFERLFEGDFAYAHGGYTITI